MRKNKSIQKILCDLESCKPQSLKHEGICNRPQDESAYAAVEGLVDLDWRSVSKEAWRSSAVIDSLTEDAFKYYLPSLLKYCWENFLEVELSFDSLIYELKTDYERSPTKRKERRFSVSKEDSNAKVACRNVNFLMLGKVRLKALREMLLKIHSKWYLEIDQKLFDEAILTIDTLIFTN